MSLETKSMLPEGQLHTQRGGQGEGIGELGVQRWEGVMGAPACCYPLCLFLACSEAYGNVQEPAGQDATVHTCGPFPPHTEAAPPCTAPRFYPTLILGFLQTPVTAVLMFSAKSKPQSLQKPLIAAATCCHLPGSQELGQPPLPPQASDPAP